MEPGKIAVDIGLASSIVTLVWYLLALRRNGHARFVARVAYGVTVVCGVGAFARLMYLVVHKQYQFDYVFRYVSNDLGYPFLAAATWAGQEGSFLLWTLWTCIIGVLVMWKAGRWEARVMPICVTALCFLYGILHWLSPFAATVRPEGWPADFPWPPTNGQGLNPSLQNYWMAIHPPTIFFGFSSLLVPFAYGIAAMIWREYESWAPRVMPWVLLTVATLGLGLFMGGYWAYETLGWHGFWAWDPVENASLFPWLGALGLLHGLIVQKSRGGMGRTNLFLAIVAWMLFLYGTFLTRSGVLSGFSVHAFDMIGRSALVLLIVMIAFYGLLGFGLLGWRWKRIPGRPISDAALSRDTAMVLAVTLMIAACTFVAIGTSWPLLSRLGVIRAIPGLSAFYSAKGMSVQAPFYNKVGSMLLIPALLVMGAVPFLAWGKTNPDKFLWRVIIPWFCAIGGGALILWFALVQSGKGFPVDTPRWLVVAIGTLGLFAGFANIALAWKVLRVKSVTVGGWLAHVGIGLLFVGTVLANVYEQTVGFNLIEGDRPVQTPFGYSLQFAGWTHDGKPAQEVAREWWQFGHGVKIRLARTSSTGDSAHGDLNSSTPGSDAFIVTAPVFHNQQLEMNARPGEPTTMRWPVIHHELFRDVYIAIADDPKLERVHVTIAPGETLPIPATDYQIHYVRFYRQGQFGMAGTVMGAEMELITPNGKHIPIRPGLMLGGDAGPTPVNEMIPQLPGAAILEGGVDAATKAVTVAFELPEAPALWRVPVSVTNKPFIGLVWLGVLLMGLGAVVAMVRRALEAGKKVPAAETVRQRAKPTNRVVEKVVARPRGHRAKVRTTR